VWPVACKTLRPGTYTAALGLVLGVHRAVPRGRCGGRDLVRVVILYSVGPTGLRDVRFIRNLRFVTASKGCKLLIPRGLSEFRINTYRNIRKC
jgi:hypothetical protein